MPNNAKEALNTKYGLQIATYLYQNPESTGKQIKNSTGIPDGTMWRNIRQMKELNMVLQEDNQYYLNQKTKDFIEKLMNKAEYNPEQYLEITSEYNHFKKRLKRLRQNYGEIIQDE